ncbi:MAG: serine/threonine protein kinase, partial [bacterium]|nr:serine/threonine protein kinase [bacterium]
MSKRKHHRPPGASSSRDTSTVNAPSSGRRRPPPPAPEAGDEVGRGTTLGRYVVVDKVGQGGMGSVYAAYDPELNRKVALKLWRDCGPSCWLDEIRARLLREAQALARLNHPHVATVYDVGTYGEQVFIAMEYLEGLTLRDWLAQEPRTRRQILDIFLQAGQGLEAAHSAGLVHRDFKPGNVMVRPDGRAVVLDFGLARDDQEDGGEQILRMDELEETSSI